MWQLRRIRHGTIYHAFRQATFRYAAQKCKDAPLGPAWPSPCLTLCCYSLNDSVCAKHDFLPPCNHRSARKRVWSSHHACRHDNTSHLAHPVCNITRRSELPHPHRQVPRWMSVWSQAPPRAGQGSEASPHIRAFECSQGSSARWSLLISGWVLAAAAPCTSATPLAGRSVGPLLFP